MRRPRMHGRPPHFLSSTVVRFSGLLLISPRLLAWRWNGEGDEAPVAGQSAVATLSERRNSLRVQDRRSETAATRNKLPHCRSASGSDERLLTWAIAKQASRRVCQNATLIGSPVFPPG